jgi:hypothetical protein
MRDKNGIAHPAADEVARWLDEGGPGPEPDRGDQLVRPSRRPWRTPMLIACAVASGVLLGVVGYMRFVRPGTAVSR